MAQHPTHADLVARALGTSSAAERAVLDRVLAADPALRAQFENIAAHLLRYDYLPPAPPPPPFAALEAALDADLLADFDADLLADFDVAADTASDERAGLLDGEHGQHHEAGVAAKGVAAKGVAAKDVAGQGANGPHRRAPDLHVLDLQTRALGQPRRSHLRWGALAAAALVAVVLWSPALRSVWNDHLGARHPDDGALPVGSLTLVPGPGMELVRAGRSLPAPARAMREVRPGDQLRCQSPAEAQLAGRVRVVLDGGASLRIELPTTTSSQGAADTGSADSRGDDSTGDDSTGMNASRPAVPPEGHLAVRLERGRAWFEVAPGAFEVRTPFGVVHVLGTAFEVDLRAGRLDVAVAHGRVAAESGATGTDGTPAADTGSTRRSRLVEIAAGWGLSDGRLNQLAGPAGAWFKRPRLTLARAATTGPLSPLRRGAPLRLDLRFANPGQVPLRLHGPGAVRTAVWISFETPEGRTVAEYPILPANVLAGQGLLEPGANADLGPGRHRVLTIEILPPLGSPGAYRCRALYRPEGQPAVLSDPLDFEVR